MATLDFATVVVLQRPTKIEDRELADFGHAFPDQHGSYIKDIITWKINGTTTIWLQSKNSPVISLNGLNDKINDSL